MEFDADDLETMFILLLRLNYPKQVVNDLKSKGTGSFTEKNHNGKTTTKIVNLIEEKTNNVR